MKKIIILTVVAAFTAAGIYGYTEYSRKNEDLSEVDAEASLNATKLIAAFEKDSVLANKHYLGKILEVDGIIKSIERERNSATVILGDAASMSSVRCSMDTTHLNEIKTVNKGELISMKGSCTGFNKDELLGSDVILNRCVVTKR